MIGDKVTLKDDYRYKDQQVGIGTVIKYDRDGEEEGWWEIRWENGNVDNYEEFGMELVSKPVKISKKERASKIKRIIKEIKSNKVYTKSFDDISKEVNEWSPEQIIGWFK